MNHLGGVAILYVGAATEMSWSQHLRNPSSVIKHSK